MDADDAARARRSRMLAALAACEDELDRHNALPAGLLALRFGRLRALLATGRLPRVAAIGRRGAGKSSLLNAIVGREVAAVGDVEDTTREVSWREVACGPRRVEWLDTPGLRAGGVRARRDAVERSLLSVPPDVVLFLCQATEVDAGIDDDLADLAALRRALARATGRQVALFGLVTKLDELPPPEVVAPPFDDPEKQAHIRAAATLLGRHLRRAGLAPLGVLPVNTYVRGDDDLRWNVDALLRRVAAALPPEAHLAGRLLVPELRRALGDVMTDVTEAFASIAAAVARAGVRRGRAEVAADLAAINAALVRVLRALAPEPARGARLSSAAQAVAHPDGALEFLRAGAARLGAESAAAAVAAARVRALGAATAATALAGLDDAALAALYAAPRGDDGSPPPPGG